ncbi:hypothetical protein [Acinetobacter sp. SA01]|uniref:hypothetical protein n=1 Tax=Acinetobacter sp. SA01 TaxID=1862567 RepID=UPI00140DBD5A|nr:hypothetical protein [Acinetobacter sp. SA01]
MSDIKLKNLDDLLENALTEGKKIEKIIIGYKAYNCLMTDCNFHKEVTESSLSANKRKYKGYKIKVTQDEYQLDLKFK